MAEILAVVVVPGPINTLPGPETLKLGAFTDSTNAVVAEVFPQVAVIVTELMPMAAELPAVNVNVLLPNELFGEIGTGFCEKTAVTPLGKPETERLTFPFKPFSP